MAKKRTQSVDLEALIRELNGLGPSMIGERIAGVAKGLGTKRLATVIEELLVRRDEKWMALDSQANQQNGKGELQVGTNFRGEVVINLPRGMVGHIVFSPNQARGLANSLDKMADRAVHEMAAGKTMG